MKRSKPAKPDAWWNFIGEDEVFEARSPNRTSRLYFPLCNEAGLLSAITPTLHGDIKTGQDSFLTLPVSSEDLHNTRSNRNFWVYVEGKGSWSIANEESGRLRAGALWHVLNKENRKLGLRADVLNFIPATSDRMEIMRVRLTNISRHPIAFTPTSAIPLFARSADNLRDHRHVTSLLHRIEQHPHGVLVTPTMAFDERGHRTNTTVYAVLGCEGDGASPEGSFPTVQSFIGEGGNFDRPAAVLDDLDVPDLEEVQLQGREAVGALRFKHRKLLPGKSAIYILFLGVADDRKEALGWLRAYGTAEKAEAALDQTQRWWKERLDRIQITTDDPDFGRWVRWVALQPMLRKVFGNSFLPDFDYGRGGRGWRDLWQDCLALLLLEPSPPAPLPTQGEVAKPAGDSPEVWRGGRRPGEGVSVRTLLLNNFAGVRMDGTNATVIGKEPGEFIADRNNLSRTWMDHGVWPWLTTEFYIHQTGDLRFLLEEAPYFAAPPAPLPEGEVAKPSGDSPEVWRGGRRPGEATKGTVLEHLLVQHLRAYSSIGEHGNCRLEDADWNDGLDMAREKGESVAFTAVYAGNLLRLADTLEVLREKLGVQEVALAAPLGSRQSTQALAADLRQKGEALAQRVRETEWIKSAAGHAWFNGYYDNHGERVEGDFPGGVRMTLTGQVFPILSGVATDEQVQECFKAAKKYLQDKKLGGFRLNTDFGEPQPQLGRAFSFAYGEKENGAFFSHMTVMFANALYRRGYAEEGYEVLSSLYRMGMHADVAKIYPGIPEYFNGEGRGMYHYLTGSASWYLLTLVTQVLGIRGHWGDLVLAPKLMAEEFGTKGQVGAQVSFAGKCLKITYINRSKKPFGHYKISSVLLQGRSLPVPPSATEVLIPRATLADVASSTVEITVALG